MALRTSARSNLMCLSENRMLGISCRQARSKRYRALRQRSSAISSAVTNLSSLAISFLDTQASVLVARRYVCFCISLWSEKRRCPGSAQPKPEDFKKTPNLERCRFARRCADLVRPSKRSKTDRPLADRWLPRTLKRIFGVWLLSHSLCSTRIFSRFLVVSDFTWQRVRDSNPV